MGNRKMGLRGVIKNVEVRTSLNSRTPVFFFFFGVPPRWCSSSTSNLKPHPADQLSSTLFTLLVADTQGTYTLDEKTTMKLTVAMVAALSARESLAFVPSFNAVRSTSSTAAAQGNMCTVRMAAGVDQGASEMSSVPMGRKQMLQSAAAAAFGAAFVSANPSQSVADSSVDYKKASCRNSSRSWRNSTRLRCLPATARIASVHQGVAAAVGRRGERERSPSCVEEASQAVRYRGSCCCTCGQRSCTTQNKAQTQARAERFFVHAARLDQGSV